MIRHPDSNLQIAEKIELALSSQNKRVNTEGTNIVTNEFNREDYVINKAQTAEKFESHELSLQGLQESKQNVLTAGDGISINNNVISATGGSTLKKLTFSNSGNGAASGSTFDGSAARTLSYNSIGAAAASHKHVVTDVSDLYLNYPAPTYIISTQAEFNNWVNNTSGNDYSSVLILGGITYTTTKSIDCALTGTSFIRGEFNPVISFTPPNPPQNTKLFNGNKATIMNVTINFSVTDTGTVYGRSYSVLFNFHGVFNVTLSGTSLLSSGYDSSWRHIDIAVVNGCSRIYNCHATIDGNVSSSGYYGTIFVYTSCKELINCVGEGITHGQGGGNSYNRCYHRNNYMRNCTGSLSGNGNNKVFDSNTNQM